ncbi:MAG: cobalt ABC transporter ATP-binding protein [Anaerolineaceae bacterium]|nr:cobalt ABC transporter ATP-binding protein [Anaerolineaceae bacterium]
MSYVIRIKSLSYRYPDQQIGLNGVDLTILPGEKVALVGANGAGKSTLIHHLNGILIGEGDVNILGMTVEKKNLKRIRGKVGVVFQNPDDQLFSSTVYEDVAYGPIYQGLNKQEVKKRVAEALSMVGMQDYIDRNSYYLSIGEKKRVSIATVLSMQPEFLVMDEPTSGLDPRARRELINLLQQLPQTMLIATHDLDLVEKILPRTVIMYRGQVVVDGPTSQIIPDSNLLENYGL